jgi:D-alanyl-D-alanine carboxypeptidase
MYRVTVGASFRLRCVVSGLIAVLLLTILASAPAEARWKKRGYFKRTAATSSYEPRYAAIVVDANTGDVLHDASADSVRHPASLTKIMTLYLLFERLEAGRLTLESKMTVSEHATEQAPTKLGLKVGQRRRRRDCRSTRRQRRGIRQSDDAQGARARHEPHAL